MQETVQPSALKSLLAPLASLRLTVVLLALALVLVYAGTWAQIDQGIWQVQKQYFHSVICWIDPAIFFPRDADGSLNSWRFAIGGNELVARIPMPGGYTLGLLLLVNLIAAHAMRFKPTWKDLVLIPATAASFAIAYAFPPQDNFSLCMVLALAPLPMLAAVAPLHGKRTGVILIHMGLILLVIGEGITSGFAVESQMTIDEGSFANFSQDIRSSELAIIDPSNEKTDAVSAIPDGMLTKGAVVKHSALPVEVHVDDFYPNSGILGPMQSQGHANAGRATAGDGTKLTAVEQPVVSGTEGGEVDAPSAYVTLKSNGQTLGTYLVSLFIDRPQTFTVGDKSYQMQLRFKRLYKPYTMHLLDFGHDRYLGTDIPKDFSSHVRLVDPTRNVDREVRIWMNNPLRYAGETFFQASFKPGDLTTVLQVVKNPAWSMPYLACAIGAVGLVAHFGITLTNFIRKRSAAGAQVPARSRRGKPGERGDAAPTRLGGWLSFPTLAAVGFVAFIAIFAFAGTLRPVGPRTAFDLKTFGTLPVSHEGRIQPLDSLARNSLKIISGRETAVTADKDGQKISAIQWLADVFGQPDKAAEYPVFRIDHKEIQGLLDLDPARKRFAFREVLNNRDKLQEQLDRAFKARQADPKGLDLFQRKIIELGDKLNVYIGLGQMQSLFLVPPLAAGEQWQPLSAGMHVAEGGSPHPAARTYLALVGALHEQKPDTFNAEVAAYAKQVNEKLPQADRKVKFEALYNRLDPFMQCIILYLAAFVLACLSWLFAGLPLRRAASAAIIIALVIHTLGLIGRIYISGRPPVTNLAASAIFIAWGGAVLAMGVEWFYRNGIGAACAAAMGFTSLLIADRLALSGDTMKVLQAVLDTNFWLATHVIVITLGYSATFLAGIIGIIYVLRGLFTRNLDKDNSKELARMIYGVTCFAILFSFVGTVLGGIWADQSWGRFWGWDPKENGAVMIVLANALLLHARWGGLVRERGIACLAIFGNIITAWSWFGTNMLGVGLHSYGFMDSALTWLLLFVVSQLLLIIVANVPLKWWASYPRLIAAQSPRGGATIASPA